MFKKKLRAVVRRGVFDKSIVADFFFFRAGKNNLPYSRFAFTVSKKIDKRATARNKLRRLLSSCLEKIFTKIVPGYDMLFIIKKDMVDKERKEILERVIFFLTREGFLE